MFPEGTIIPFPADSVQSFLRTPCPPGLFEYFKGAFQTAVYAVFSALLFSALLFSGM